MACLAWLVIACMVGFTLSYRVMGETGDIPPLNGELDTAWRDYKQTFNKTYTQTVEQSYRRYVWEENVAAINRHNREAALGKHSYWMGVNQFTDMTPDEFASKMLTGFRPLRKYAEVSNVTDKVWATLPTSVDWRDKNLVTGVKDQGGCGSCWAFSAVGSIEGQHARKTGSLVSLSEQNLVDCADASWGNAGCNGGHMEYAFEYVAANGGIDTESCYPYKAVQGNCKYSKSCIGATVTGYVSVPQGEAALTTASAGVGPITVGIMVTSNLQYYMSGVFIDTTCNSYELNHGVLVVGYTPQYWIVKNSWGTAWGMSGYVHFARNRGNMCGIASEASYPTV